MQPFRWLSRGGTQYAAREYIDVLRVFQLRISMSRKGNPYNNAVVESFMKTLGVSDDGR
ncbi:MAG: hypothetical protein WCO26_02650 [Deltaproteobacteria bacterium]